MMRIKRTRDTRSYYRRFMDFVFGEKLTDEEIAEREKRMIRAKCFLLGAGGGGTGKVEIISMKAERKKDL
jgi:hypothetical protein